MSSSPATTQACGAVDPADVSVSTAKDGGVAEATATSGRAAEKTDEPQGPSTSSGTGLQRRQLDGPEASSASEALRRPRKSLPFLPRTTQYERHPLLQMRSTATGLSEFELLMLERDADERPRRMSVETSATSSQPSSGRIGGRPPLVPRTAQRETHPLFVRSADSGISELEEYLKEISEMTPPARKTSAVGSASAQGRSSVSTQPTSSTDGESRVTPTPRRLEPRTSQCERHALLEIKDESGMTELERLLMEKDEAAAAGGSDGRRCTVCGAEAHLRCDCSRRTDRDGVNADRLRSVSDTEAGGFSSSDSATAQQKRVRFMQQRQKTEPGSVAAAQLERTLSDSTATAAAPPPTAKSNSVDASAAAKKPNKSRSSRGRGAGVRTDSSPAGVGTGGAAHRKSCCVS